MRDERTLTLTVRILEECLENDYSVEELQSKIRDILKLLEGLDGLHLSGGVHLEDGQGG